MRVLTLAFISLWLALAPAKAQTIPEMAGQMVMVGFNGQSRDAAGVGAVRAQIAAGQIGGVMYLRSNVSSLGAVRAMNRGFQAARPWQPPFIALDQEGGQIERLTRSVGFTEIPSAAAVARQGATAARGIYADLASELSAQGFNVNFGPVVDLDLNPSNPIIARYQRSFGDNPDMVTALGAAFVEAHRAAGIATSLKHFPGHGSSREDSHEGFVDVTGVWQEAELEPFRALIGQGLADMVMVAHLYNGDIQGADDLQLPASLSPEWITGILREQLGFDGVVISDDLEMGAIRSRFSLEEVVVRAVAAGQDILLFSNTAAYDPALGPRIRAILVEHAGADPVFASRIRESYGRIIALKRELGIVP